MSTRDRILNASIDLFSQYGYRAVTTKQIAQTASVNEVTLFRHFGTKQSILEETINKFVFEVAVRKMFVEEILWDLEKDLLFIGRAHNEIMRKNKKIFLIMIKEFKVLEGEEKNPLIKFPKKLMELLTEYFIEMQKKGLVRKDDPKTQAASLLCMSFGVFMGSIITQDELMGDAIDYYLTCGVKTLIRGLAP